MGPRSRAILRLWQLDQGGSRGFQTTAISLCTSRSRPRQPCSAPVHAIPNNLFEVNDDEGREPVLELFDKTLEGEPG